MTSTTYLIQSLFGLIGVATGFIGAVFWMGRMAQKVTGHETRIVKLEDEYLTEEHCHDCKINIEDRLDEYQKTAIRVAEEIRSQAIRGAAAVREEALKVAESLETLTKERMDHISESLKSNADM